MRNRNKLLDHFIDSSVYKYNDYPVQSIIEPIDKRIEFIFKKDIDCNLRYLNPNVFDLKNSSLQEFIRSRR